MQHHSGRWINNMKGASTKVISSAEKTLLVLRTQAPIKWTERQQMCVLRSNQHFFELLGETAFSLCLSKMREARGIQVEGRDE